MNTSTDENVSRVAVTDKLVLSQGQLQIYRSIGEGKGKAGIAVHGTPSHSYGMSLAIWDHTVLPATRHKWQVTLRLHPSQSGRYSIYLPRKDGRLS